LNMPQKLKVDVVNVVQPQVDKLYELVQENYEWKIDSLS